MWLNEMDDGLAVSSPEQAYASAQKTPRVWSRNYLAHPGDLLRRLSIPPGSEQGAHRCSLS